VLTGESIEIWGDGSQVRDPLFIEDAVQAFLAAGAKEFLRVRTFNAGGSEALSLRYIAETLAMLQPGVTVVQKPFPDEIRRIDIGSFQTDNRRARAELGWHPRTYFRNGAERTLAFYRSRLSEYLREVQPHHSLIQ
jgi:nucleoside-diphosphate-sugar epimerase